MVVVSGAVSVNINRQLQEVRLTHSTCISRFSFLYWCCLCMNIADLWPCSSCCSLLLVTIEENSVQKSLKQ